MDKDFLFSDESPRIARTYNRPKEMIRVDMIRKLVIIAIGGKIGNPFPS